MNLIPYTDSRLYRPSDPVLDVASFRDLTDKLFELMKTERAAGIAAPQVGANVQLFVCKLKPCLVAFNPSYSPATTDRTSKPESSISRRGWSTYVARPAAINATWINANGEECQTKLVDMEARIFMHLTDLCAGKTLWVRPRAPAPVSG